MFEEGAHYTLLGFILALVFIYIKAKLNNIWDYNKAIKNLIDEMKYNIDYYNSYIFAIKEINIPAIKKNLPVFYLPKFNVKNNFYVKFNDRYSIYQIIPSNKLIELDHIFENNDVWLIEQFTDGLSKYNDLLTKHNEDKEDNILRDEYYSFKYHYMLRNETIVSSFEVAIRNLDKATNELNNNIITYEYYIKSIEKKMKKHFQK